VVSLWVDNFDYQSNTMILKVLVLRSRNNEVKLIIPKHKRPLFLGAFLTINIKCYLVAGKIGLSIHLIPLIFLFNP
jgi:hypothetical protein